MALINLKADTSIIIQKADKGGGIVVLDAIDYVKKIMEMLNIRITYTPTPHIDLVAAKSEIDGAVHLLHNNDFIYSRKKRHLTQCQPKIPILYGLLKIHKPIVPLRPIVSQINPPAYRLN